MKRIVMILMMAAATARVGQGAEDEFLEYGDLIEAVRAGQVVSIRFSIFDQGLSGVRTVEGEEKAFQSRYPGAAEQDVLLQELLESKGVRMEATGAEEAKTFAMAGMVSGVLFLVVPLATLVLVILIYVKVRRMGSGQESYLMEVRE